MASIAQYKKRCVIQILHHGCWASELSKWIHIQRPDIELVVFARSVSDDPFSYRAVAVLKSKEKKEIDHTFHSAVSHFLLQHTVIRAIQPRLPRPSKYTTVLLIATHDESSPGAIRVVLKNGGKVNEQIGMPIINGVEYVTFFAREDNASAITAEIQSEFAKESNIYEVLGAEIKDREPDNNQPFSDPYYLPTYILCSEKRRSGFLKTAKNGIDDITAWIVKNAPWLIPLLSRILEWLFRAPTSGTYPTHIISYCI